MGRLEGESNTTTSSSSTTRSLPRNVATECLSPLRVSPGRKRGHRSGMDGEVAAGGGGGGGGGHRGEGS